MTILIAGGTGLIGRRLTELLIEDGHTVYILSRQNLANTNSIKYFNWRIDESIDEQAFYKDTDGTVIDGIINLTGAGIADKRWTAKRKAEIIGSRVKPAAFLQSTLERLNLKLPVYISASGVNYYDNSLSRVYVEDDPVGSEFVQEVCQKWEDQAFQMQGVANRVIAMRTGVVLARNGSFLQKFTATTKVFVAGIFGSGKQFLSWIHIDDLCEFYIHALKTKQMSGAYNAAICDTETHLSFLKNYKKGAKKSFLVLKAPVFAANLIFGEMATLLTHGVAVSNHKMLTSGFQPNFKTVEKAVGNLI